MLHSHAKNTFLLRIIEALHERNEICLASLQKIAPESLPFQKNGENELLIPLMLTSYIADEPESESLLGIMRWSRIGTLRQLCEAQKHDFLNSTNITGKNLQRTRSLSSDISCSKKKIAVEVKFANTSIFFVHFVYQSFF